MLFFRDIYDLNEAKRFNMVNERLHSSVCETIKNNFYTDVAMATITFSI